MMKKKKRQREDNDVDAYDHAEAVAINSTHIGGDFNDFLAEEGILEEVQATAIKRVIAFQLQKDMKNKGL